MAGRCRLAVPTLAAALLGGCASAAVLRYSSDDPSDRWESGVRLHSARAGRALFVSTFAGVDLGDTPGLDSRTLTFSLLARNESDSDLRLDPGDFRVWDTRTGKAYPPIDPEGVLEILDRDRRSEIGLAAVQRDFRGLMAIPLLAGQIAALAGDAEARAEAAKAFDESERAESEETDRHRAALSDLEAHRRHWSEDALRRTDLRAGRSLSGDLVFRFPDRFQPPDTLLMQWRAPDGRFLELGRYGRPLLPSDTAAPVRAFSQRGQQSPFETR
jgi:hypothetical protein